MTDPKLQNIGGRKTLRGDEAIKLWKQGRDVWNKWADEVGECDVIFIGVDFSKFRELKTILVYEWPFEAYRFPTGKVSFAGARFGGGDLSFAYAQFGDGEVFFNDTRFGDGNVSFTNAQFGKDDVNFENAQFGEGSVNFAHAKFENGASSFANAKFGEGDVYFSDARFEGGEVSFRKAQFGEGNVHFTGTRIHSKNISFHSAQFDRGNIHFNKAEFVETTLDFQHANLGDGLFYFYNAKLKSSDAYFHATYFGEGEAIFERSVFDGLADFEAIKKSSDLTELSFRHCSFKRALVLSSDEPFGCVPDLRQTKTEHHVSLDGLRITLRKKLVKRFGFIWVEAAENDEDADRLVRLKQLAQDNKDHDAALEFLALEQQAKRWVRMGNFMSLVDIAYSGVSDYGRSIGRPLALLMMLCFGFAYGYDVLSRPAGVAPYQHVSAWFDERGADALVYSATGTIPLVPAARKAAGESYDKLQIETSENRVTISFLTMLQGLLSTILLFLIGLALRNRFRV